MNANGTDVCVCVIECEWDRMYANGTDVCVCVMHSP